MYASCLDYTSLLVSNGKIKKYIEEKKAHTHTQSNISKKIDNDNEIG